MSQPRIGQLRQRLVLESPVRIPDGGGGAIESWLTVAEIWASLTPATGAESVPAEAIAGHVSHVVVMRHRSDVVPAMRLRSGTRLFEITAILDADGRRRHLKCLCRERDL